MYYGYVADDFEPHPELPPAANGNGNGKHSPTEEEREPAVV
jgi:hypothetical protein